MGLIGITDERVFTLSNAHFTYAMRVGSAGHLEQLYFGAPIAKPDATSDQTKRHCTVMFEDKPDLTLNALRQDYPTAGRGDYGEPALDIVGPDNSVLSLHYKAHQVVPGKPELSRLPAARGRNAETLIVTLADPVQSIEVDLFYTIWPDHSVLARRAVIRNVGSETLTIRRACSTALDLPSGDYEVQHFHGTWAKEFNEERLALPHGTFAIGSTRGTSSNAHSPYLALLDAGATETSGHCIGTTLLYSGNHRFSVERGEFGRVRLLAGINPFDFDWSLDPGDAFETPEALHSYSGEGLGGLSHAWHGFIRAHVTPERFNGSPRATYLNSWEAAYFDIDAKKVESLADRAVSIGVEMLVLDDGWFRGRTDDRRALGDWTADPIRFGDGIAALADNIWSKGLKFGLWVEPEMVSPDSDLYRDHPDWIINVAGRTPSLGRNQLTLDISNPDVVDHIQAKLDAILSKGSIDYVKWDMNRNMTEVDSGARAHRYMLGLYDLLDRITSAYPDIMFENCASGGNRFDLGMIRYMAQSWTSDMVDPIGRLSIINGASHLFPTDVMAAYIGPSPNHQNGRVTSLKTRFAAGSVCAAQGISLGLDALQRHEAPLRNYVRQMRSLAKTMPGARFDRLRHTDNETVWQQTSRDGETVLLVAIHVLNAPNLPTRKTCLRGLDPLATYRSEDGRMFSGDRLMNQGIALAPPTEDFFAELLILTKVS